MTEPPDLTGYLTTAQVAEQTGMKQVSVAHLLESGALRGIKVATRLWLVEAESLEEYEKSKKHSGRPRKNKPRHSKPMK